MALVICQPCGKKIKSATAKKPKSPPAFPNELKNLAKDISREVSTCVKLNKQFSFKKWKYKVKIYKEKSMRMSCA